MPETDGGAGDADAVFTMDPVATMWQLAQHLVDGQRTLARLDLETAAAVAEADTTESRAVREDFVDTRNDWYTRGLPSVAASMRLALEVFETFGPGPAVISDKVEAATWNNKYFVWVKEMSAGI